MPEINLKQSLLDIATAKKETAPILSRCLTMAAENAIGAENTSNDEKNQIISAVVGECAAGDADIDGSSAWINAILKVQNEKIAGSKSFVDTVFDFLTWE